MTPPVAVAAPVRARGRTFGEVVLRARGEDAQRLTALLNEAADKAAQNRFAKGTAKLRRDMERKAIPEVEAMWRDLGKRVAAATAKSGGLVVEQREADVALSRKEQARINAIVKAVDVPGFAKAKVDPWLEKLYEGAWLGTYSVAQDNLTPTQRDQVQRAVLRAGGRRLGLIDITGDVRAALFRVLEFSREWEGGQPSPRQVAKWLQSEVPAGRFVNAGPRYRAQLIARTEIMHATRVSQVQLAKKDPYVNTLTAMDGDQDEECAYRNGTDFSIADADAELLKTHPNCVLSFVPSYQLK